MSDVFISYSRKDIAFARLLHKSLKDNQLETWVDWQDIPPSADWLAEVYTAIENSDALIFIISDTSLASDICSLEIAHAAKHNKRLIPIVIHEIEPGNVPPVLSVLNWIFFDDEALFAQFFNLPFCLLLLAAEVFLGQLERSLADAFDAETGVLDHHPAVSTAEPLQV